MSWQRTTTPRPLIIANPATVLGLSIVYATFSPNMLTCKDIVKQYLILVLCGLTLPSTLDHLSHAPSITVEYIQD